MWVDTQSKAAAGLTRDQPGQLAWFVHNAFMVSTLYVREQAAINDFYFLIKAAENNVFLDYSNYNPFINFDILTLK